MIAGLQNFVNNVSYKLSHDFDLQGCQYILSGENVLNCKKNNK